MEWFRFNGYCILDIECSLYYMYCITYSISAWYYKQQESCFTVRPTLLTMVAGGNIEMESPFYIYSYAHVLWMQGVTWIISTLLKFSLGGNSGSAICEDINISFQRLWYIGFLFWKVTEPGREESQPLSVRGVGSEVFPNAVHEVAPIGQGTLTRWDLVIIASLWS